MCVALLHLCNTKAMKPRCWRMRKSKQMFEFFFFFFGKADGDVVIIKRRSYVKHDDVTGKSKSCAIRIIFVCERELLFIAISFYQIIFYNLNCMTVLSMKLHQVFRWSRNCGCVLWPWCESVWKLLFNTWLKIPGLEILPCTFSKQKSRDLQTISNLNCWSF